MPPFPLSGVPRPDICCSCSKFLRHWTLIDLLRLLPFLRLSIDSLSYRYDPPVPLAPPFPRTTRLSRFHPPHRSDPPAALALVFCCCVPSPDTGLLFRGKAKDQADDTDIKCGSVWDGLASLTRCVPPHRAARRVRASDPYHDRGSTVWLDRFLNGRGHYTKIVGIPFLFCNTV